MKQQALLTAGLCLLLAPYANRGASLQLGRTQFMGASGPVLSSAGNGPSFSIIGSIGQPVTTAAMPGNQGGGYTARPGFWPSAGGARGGETGCIVINCPGNMVVPCTGPDGAHVSFFTTASNICVPNSEMEISCSPPSGSLFVPGITLVQCQAVSLIDGRRVTNYCSFNVTVSSNCAPTTCTSNLLVNGSFELPGSSEGWIDVAGGATLIPGWTPLLNGVEYYRPMANRWGVVDGRAREGDYCVDLTPFERSGGGVAQTFATVPGRSYHVSFYISTLEREGRDGTGSLVVTAPGTSLGYSAENHSRTHQWHLKRFDFVATDVLSTLAFQSTNDWQRHFVFVDDVRVTDCCVELLGPAEVVAECQTPNGAPVAWILVAENHCSPGDVTITCTPPSGSWFPPGVTTVTCVAAGSGAVQTHTFPVIVAGSCGGLCEENLLVNGSFEQPGDADGYAAISAGANPALLPGWRVLPAGVEYYDGTSLHGAVREAGTAPDGSFAVDLAFVTSTTGGGMEQSVTTVPGEAYTLSFYAATMERDGRLGTGRLEVSAGPVSRLFDLENHNNHLEWSRYSLSFIATETSSLIKLTTTNNANYHFMEIDDVRLTRCPAPCARPPLDLVLWMEFDEIGGLTAYNAVAPTYNGRLFSGARSDGSGPARIGGHVNGALQFDGIDDWICVGDAPQLNVGTNDFSIDAWIRLDPEATNGTDRLIVGKFREHGTGIRFGLNEGYLFFRYDDALAIHIRPDTRRVPLDGRWHLVALTFEHNRIDGGRFYVDGALQSTFDTRSLPFSFSTPGPLGVGGLYGQSPWAGGLDEVELFRRSLTSAEISELYRAGSAGKCRLDAILHWDTMLCPNDVYADVPATIRNFSGTAKTVVYQLSAESCPGSTNTYALSFSPPIGAYVVPPYGEIEFPVRVTLPAGMPCDARACFKMTVEDADGLRAISPEAVIFRSCRACVTVSQFRVPLTNLLRQTIAPIRLQNFGTVPLSLDGARFVVYGPGMQIDSRVVSLNSMQPGPILIPQGTSVPPNGILDLSLDVAFLQFQPGQRFTVVLEASLGNNRQEAVASFDIINEFPRENAAEVKARRRPDGAIEINWTDDSAVLEAAPTINGPWTEVPSEATNALVSPPFKEPAMYFRARR